MVVPTEVMAHLRPAQSEELSTTGTGLLVAACVNRAPVGTFGAAVAEVGVLDLLKVR
jgi:prolyl oligopeptidase PreP (S9A serine peptidase family)